MMNTRPLFLFLALLLYPFANGEELDASFELMGWWRSDLSTITMDFYLTVHDSTAVIMDTAWVDSGALFENPFCQFTVRDDSHEIVLKRKRWTQLPYRPTLFSNYGSVPDRIRTYLDFDSLSEAGDFAERTGTERFEVRVEMGVYFPDERGHLSPKGVYPFFLKSDWLSLEVNWDEHAISFVNAPLPEGNPMPLRAKKGSNAQDED